MMNFQIILAWIIGMFLIQGCTCQNKSLQGEFKHLSLPTMINPNKCSGGEHIQVNDIIANKCLYAKKENRPILLTGNNKKAVILLHGFIGSPFEVSSIAKELNQAGYTVFSPLIYGFGGDTVSANNAAMEDWKTTLIDSIEFLKPCYNKFILIGFSLGGTIVMDYILSGISNDENVSINSVVLVAPYYKGDILGGRTLNSFANFFFNSISLNILYNISFHSDLLIPLSNPDYYNKDMPLNAISEIFKFEDSLEKIPLSVQSDIPTLLITSKHDKIISQKETIAFVSTHFKDSRFINYEKSKKIRHQILVPEANPYIEESHSSILKFINGN